MPDIILPLITALHENSGARITVGQKLSPRISTTSGVGQGCILAPILFCAAIDWIIQHMSFNPGITVGSSTFTTNNCQLEETDMDPNDNYMAIMTKT